MERKFCCTCKNYEKHNEEKDGPICKLRKDFVRRKNTCDEWKDK